MTMHRIAVLAALAAALVLVVPVHATAPPVGPLPKGPVTTISTARGSLVSIALPARAGTSWRLARAVNPKVLVEVTEANVGSNVVVIYRATGRGSVKVAYGLTRGERPKAYASATFNVRVR
jgi:hypothetical protein